MPSSQHHSPGIPTLAPTLGSPSARFHRFAPRPLSYADPRSASPLPPFARGRRFLEHAETLTASAWESVHDRVATSTDLHHAADQHLCSMFVTPARMTARDAIAREARRVCICALQSDRIRSSHVAELTRAVTSAALGLVLRDLLPPELFALSYGPFTNVMDDNAPDVTPDLSVIDVATPVVTFSARHAAHAEEVVAA